MEEFFYKDFPRFHFGGSSDFSSDFFFRVWKLRNLIGLADQELNLIHCFSWPILVTTIDQFSVRCSLRYKISRGYLLFFLFWIRLM